MPIVGGDTAAGGMPGADENAAEQKEQAVGYEDRPY